MFRVRYCEIYGEFFMIVLQRQGEPKTELVKGLRPKPKNAVIRYFGCFNPLL